MKNCCCVRQFLHSLLLASIASAQNPSAPVRTPSSRAPVTANATPWARGEVLNYSVNWPSGLSLGEANFKAGGGEPGWQFEFNIEAGLPGLEIRDHYRSSASAQFCSENLGKD